MVPGSTLIYGSSFISVTRRPRASSRHPIEDAARPLPKLETTPPVTKMYLGIAHSSWVGTPPACCIFLLVILKKPLRSPRYACRRHAYLSFVGLRSCFRRIVGLLF